MDELRAVLGLAEGDQIVVDCFVARALSIHQEVVVGQDQQRQLLVVLFVVDEVFDGLLVSGMRRARIDLCGLSSHL